MSRSGCWFLLAIAGFAAPANAQDLIGDGQELLTIGSLDGPLETSFGAIAEIEVAPRGEIVVLDRGDQTIRVFSPAGDHLVTFGREGSGPAEFRALTASAMRGDTLVVFDWRLQKIASFTLDGKLIDTRRIAFRCQSMVSCSGCGPFATGPS